MVRMTSHEVRVLSRPAEPIQNSPNFLTSRRNYSGSRFSGSTVEWLYSRICGFRDEFIGFETVKG